MKQELSDQALEFASALSAEKIKTKYYIHLFVSVLLHTLEIIVNLMALSIC